MRLALGSLAVGLALLLPAPARAEESIPRNDGWVTDLAGMLNEGQEQALEALMESYRAGSTNEIALLTVPNLGGRALEQLSLEVARTWRIGSAERHNGALLLVARDERKVRIEVGRGLEGNLTDSICGRIIRDVITPAFKQGRYYEGLRAGIEALHAAAGGDYAKIPRPPGRHSRETSFAALLPLVLLVLLFIGLSRGGRGGRRGNMGLLPWLILSSMASGGGRSSGGFRSGGSGGFGGFGGGGGFSGGGASGGW